MDEDEKQLYSYNIPSVLVMNKVDLVTSKRRLKDLQHDIIDLCPFDHIFHVSCNTGFGIPALMEYLVQRAEMRPWRYHPNQTSTKSEVKKAEEALKQAIMERYFREIPYQVGIKVEAWVPKLNGELRIDFHVDVKNDVQQGIMLGQRGRIIKEVRERCQQLLTEQLQRPVVCVISIAQRRNSIAAQNLYDEEHQQVDIDNNQRRKRARQFKQT